MIQMLFVPFGNTPEDTVHIASFFRQNGGNTIPSAIGAERKSVSFQADGIDHFRIRAAERHLIQVHIRAICKIKFFFGFDHLLSFMVLVILQAGILSFIVTPCPVAGKV